MLWRAVCVQLLWLGVHCRISKLEWLKLSRCDMPASSAAV
jgi:hypothetical protein